MKKLVSQIVSKYHNDWIKKAIGASLDNNRVVSMSQLISFMSQTPGLKRKSEVLSKHYSRKRRSLRRIRGALTFRTDALDVNEYLAYVSHAF